jgi:radical SAM superfamily enzyme YgiQ (UPF0313 family)
MTVMLCAPPNWTPAMPHLALPTLTAYLRSHGVTVLQRDLNLEVFDALLTRDYLRESISRLRQQASAPGQRHHATAAAPPERIRWALQQGPWLANQVEQAKATIRSERFFDGPIGLAAFDTVINCLEIASLPFYPAVLSLQSYESAFPIDNSRALLRAVRDPRYNIFLDLYRRTIVPEIMREAPDVVGISIPSMPQMLAGMTLAYLVKESGLNIHVTVGGPHITMLREQIAKTPALFTLIDSVVVFDGEVPLLRLVEALERGGNLEDVPNLIYLRRSQKGTDNGQIRVTARKEPEKIENLPLPDFDGLPLDRYLAPHLVLPLMTARGCYFGKCAFCNVGYGEADSFSQLRAERLADQMQTLHQRYGVRHIFFADEAVTPRNLNHLSAMLHERALPLHWGGCARFEKVLSSKLLEQMHKGGCRMILFGLESASPPVMDLMVKGIELDHMSRILRQSTEAGIWNHTFFFFGFPGETLADAQETVNFLYAHKQYIHSAALGTFLMERDSPAHRFPQSYKVKRILEDPEKDLAIYFDYEVESGMDSHMAELVEAHFLNTLPDKHYPQFYVSDVFRFLYASHLNEHKLPLSPWLVAETTAT